MKLEKIIQALPIAMAAQAGQLPPALTIERSLPTTDLHASLSPLDQAGGTEDPVLLEAPEAPVSEELVQKISFRSPGETWENAYQERYDELVEKEALGAITRNELQELDQLQKTRRRLVAPPSTAELVARHRREKLDRELTAVLQKYVRLTPLSKDRT